MQWCESNLVGPLLPFSFLQHYPFLSFSEGHIFHVHIFWSLPMLSPHHLKVQICPQLHGKPQGEPQNRSLAGHSQHLEMWSSLKHIQLHLGVSLPGSKNSQRSALDSTKLGANDNNNNNNKVAESHLSFHRELKQRRWQQQWKHQKRSRLD